MANYFIRHFLLGSLLLCLFSQSSLPAHARPARQPSEQTAPIWQDTECPFPVKRRDRVTCGALTVPEDRANPDSPLIDLAVAIFAAKTSKTRADPILYLEGGPGGSALSTPDFWIESPLRNVRDLIVFDQRGTGYSVPALNCPAAEEIEGVDAYEAEQEQARACRAFWEAEGFDLAAYNSAASAADVEDLRIALGIERWNLYGISYGTRLALTVMRDFPDGVRAVVLDSVYPPNIDAYTEQAMNNADAILFLLDECRADRTCRRAFPDLEEHLYEVINRLNDEPTEIDGVEWTGNDFVNFLVSSLYDTETIPALPRVIEAAYEEDYDPWQELEAGASEEMQRPKQEEEEVSEDAQGMFWSVECYEEAPFGDLEKAGELVEAYPAELRETLLADVENFYIVCDIWQVGDAPALEDRAVRSPIPTLLFAGQLDPITPPSWAKLAAKSLSNSFYFEAPRAGHGITAYWECPQKMMISFLNSPSRQPNGDCLEEEVLSFETE